MSTMRVDTIEEKTSGNGVKIPGHIIQVLDFTLGTQESYSVGGGSFSGYSGLQGVITPKFNTSKILIMATTNIQAFVSAQEVSGGLRLLRDSSEIIEYPYAFVMEAGTSGGSRIFYNTNHSAVYLDSPATTSSTTYKVQLKSRKICNNSKIVRKDTNTFKTI